MNWINCKEKKPPVGTPLLVWSTTYRFDRARFDGDIWLNDNWHRDVPYDHFTHWAEVEGPQENNPKDTLSL